MLLSFLYLSYLVIGILLIRIFHGIKRVIVLLWFLWFALLGLFSPTYFLIFDGTNELLKYDLGDLMVHRKALLLILLTTVSFFVGVFLITRTQRKLPKIQLGKYILWPLVILMLIKSYFIQEGYVGSLTGLYGTQKYNSISQFFVFIPGLILLYKPRKIEFKFVLVVLAILIDLSAGDRRQLLKYGMLLYTILFVYRIRLKRRYFVFAGIAALTLAVFSTYYGFYLEGRDIDFSQVSFADSVRLIPDAFFGWAGQYYIVTAALDMNSCMRSFNSILGPILFLFNNSYDLALKEIENMIFFYVSDYNIASSILTLPMTASSLVEFGVLGVILFGYLKGLFYGFLLSLVQKDEIIISGILAFNSFHVAQNLLISSRAFLLILIMIFFFSLTSKHLKT